MKILLNAIEENVKLIRGKNTTYSDASLFTCMIWAGINRISIDELLEFRFQKAKFLFDREVVIAIDYNLLEWYGEECLSL